MSEHQFTYSMTDLCVATGLSEEHVTEFVAHGIIEPGTEGEDGRNWVFDAHAVFTVSKACRLQRDLELDWSAVTLVLDLLEQREQLERENLALQRQLDRFLAE